MFIPKGYFKNINPLVIFSLGLIVGASIVALIFFYRLMSPEEYGSASIRYKLQTVKSLTTETATMGGPQPTVSMGGPQPTVSMGGPQPTVSMGGPQPTVSMGGPQPTVSR